MKKIKWAKWSLLGLGILIAAFIGFYLYNSVYIWPSTDAKYITAVPVDLNQIQSISKYRSCAGHIRNGYSFDKVLETSDDRSMKHYFLPIPELEGTSDKVKIFAPFDGKVINLNMESSKVVPGRKDFGNGVDLSTSKDRNVVFGFGHVYFVRDFKIGDNVKAGELLGYAAVGQEGSDFDLDLKGRTRVGGGGDGKEILGSVFDHMTDSVLAEFAKYGVTPENTKITKEYRNTNPCDDSKADDGNQSENYVTLKQ
jgi:hypothetical protein